ncbi:H-NS histone family protein [Vibrio parahaemolyticus]|nr:H-NS family nucleoid-associated regulatory protein [Vibrio parahaemolyticus]KAB5597877.1 H-NS histone family protein [Vibrio parahaemolyticus]
MGAKPQEALAKLTTVVEERREADELEQLEREEQEEKMAAIAKQIAQQGIDVEELVRALANETKPKAKRTPRPAKYKYTDANGAEKTWTGQGRTPAPIQEQLDAGKSLNDFLI